MCSYIASSMLCSALPPQLLNIFLCVLRMDVLHIFIYAAANIDYIYIMPNFLFFHRLRNATYILGVNQTDDESMQHVVSLLIVDTLYNC